jgi:hypothetical protein
VYSIAAERGVGVFARLFGVWVGKIYRVGPGHPPARFGPKPLRPPVGFRFKNRSTYLSYFGKNNTRAHKSSAAAAVAAGRYDIIILLAANP